MAHHRIEPDERSLRSHFSRDIAPVLTIDPGDTVTLRTLDAGWGLEPPNLDRTPRRKQPLPADAPFGGHALVGPIAVRGAEPGMALEVRIEALRPGPWGWTFSGGFDTPLNQRLGLADGPEALLLWALDADRLVGRCQLGLEVALRPFLGIIGTPPPEPGPHPTWAPWAWGGNLDCRELVAGSTLWLPIGVPGALLSVGDGHAAQGDGELGGTAIECPMDEVRLSIGLRHDLDLRMPLAETPAGWLTLGVHEELSEAVHLAVEGMVGLIGRRYGLGAKEALAVASAAVDVRVTQLVNGTVGAHALLPHGALRRAEAG